MYTLPDASRAALVSVPVCDTVCDLMCSFTADDTEKLCQSLDLQQLQQVCDAASAAGLDAAGQAAALADAVKAQQQRVEQEAAEKEQKKKEAEQALKVWQHMIHSMEPAV